MKLSEEVIAELETLKVEDNSTPEAIVERARDPTSALHAEFEKRSSWDMTKAAYNDWLRAAKDILSDWKLTIVEHSYSYEIKAVVAHPDQKGVYRSTVAIKEHDEINNALGTLRQRTSTTKANLEHLKRLAQYWGFAHEELEESGKLLETFLASLDTYSEENWPRKKLPPRKRRGGDDKRIGR